MLFRFGSYVLSSVIAHCAFFAVLAGVPATVDGSARIEAVEFVTITSLGGGRAGVDSQIGDAVKPVAPPEKKFRRVEPERARHAPVAVATPSKTPEADPTPSEGAEHDETRVAEASGAASHSLVMGSAGDDPNSKSAGSGRGDEGIDRRSALRAWLREIQREVNKIATRNYPSSAVRMRLEGSLRLGITIGADGRILGVRVLTSSGHTVLDDSATESVMALRIPPPDEALRWQEREISLPIRYALH